MKFRLFDLLFFMMALGVLSAIYLPQLEQRWQESRGRKCEDQLRAVGIGLHVLADCDPRSRFCSGAYDWERDGCPDASSWVGDLVLDYQLNSQTLVCPVNPARGTEGLNGLLSKSVTALDPESICGAQEHEGFQGTAANFPLAQTREDSPDRMRIVGDYFLGNGLNTNYTPSWTLVRGTIPLQARGSVCKGYTEIAIVGDPKLPTTPYTRRMMEAGGVLASAIPFLADGAICDKLRATLVSSSSRTTHRNRLAAQAGLVPATNAPAMRSMASDAGTVRYVSIQKGDVIPVPDLVKSASDQPPARENYYLPDTRGWSAVHQAGSRRWVNMLMGDGSVKSFDDLDGDGHLNPGFLGTGNPGEYQTSTVELPPTLFREEATYLWALRRRSCCFDG